MMRALIIATLLATPAATYIPEPHIFQDGSTLLDIAEEMRGNPAGLYVSPLAKGEFPSMADSPPALIYGPPDTSYSSGVCTWPNHRSSPDRCGYAATYTGREGNQPTRWLSGGTVGGGSGQERVSPAPVPLPAAGWMALAGLAALAGLKLRRTQ